MYDCLGFFVSRIHQVLTWLVESKNFDLVEIYTRLDIGLKSIDVDQGATSADMTRGLEKK